MIPARADTDAAPRPTDPALPDGGTAQRRGSARAVLAVLLVAVGALWLVSAAGDLPYLHHPDEPTNLRIVDEMVDSGDPNPHFFNYPSLFFYLHAAVNLDGPLLGWAGDEDAPTSLVRSVAMSETPASVMVHRALSVVLGLLALVAAYESALLLTARRWLSLVAPALLATSLTLTMNARVVAPDVLSVALVTATLWAALRLLRAPGWSAHVVAGVTAGLATSSKYNAVLVLATVGAASLLAKDGPDVPGDQRGATITLRWSKLAAAGAAAVAAFVLTSPYSLLDRTRFIDDLRFEQTHYSTGHAGMDGNALGWYLHHLVTSEWLLTAAAVAGLVVAVTRRKWRELGVLLAFPAVYGVVISSQAVRNDRTALLLLPSCAVLAAFGLGLLLERDGGALTPGTGWTRWRTPLIVAGVAVLVLQAAHLRQAFDTRESTYEASRRWIEEHVPTGAPVLIETYSPWVDPEVYEVTAVTTLAGAEVDPGSYVVASEAVYERYLEAPDRFPEHAAAYRSLFDELDTVAVIEGNGPRIRIMERR